MNSFGKFMLLTFLYFITGKLGLMLAVPPGYATALWPPSGVAFAGLLVFGNRFWPSILLGSVLVNIGTPLDFSSPDFLLVKGLPALLIGSGAALQALSGAVLVRRNIGYPISLINGKDVIKFLFLAGPLSCLINSTIGIGTLLLFHKINSGSVLFSWWTWWIGDCIGVLIFAPIMMMFVAQPREIWKGRRTTVAVPMIITFFLIGILFIFVRNSEEARIREELEAQAELMTTSIHNEVERYLDILFSLKSFYLSSENVERSEFAAFVENALSRYPGILAVEWDPKVVQSQRDDFEVSIREEGITDFEIKELNAQGEVLKSGQREYYFPITYVEPLNELNKKVLGIDFMSDKSREKAFEISWQTGTLAFTRPLDLIQGPRGIAAFLGIYSDAHNIQTPEERLENLKGFVVEMLNLETIIVTALKDFKDRNFIFDIVDQDPVAGNSEVFRRSIKYLDDPIDHMESVKKSSMGVIWQKVIKHGGRSWQINVYPTADYFLLRQNWSMWFILAGGLLFVSFLGGFLLVLSGRETLVRRRVDERTLELNYVNDQLRVGIEQKEKLTRSLEIRNKEIEESRLVALNIAQDAQEAQLKASEAEERFRMIVEGVKDYGIYLLDVNGNVVTWNLGAERFTGYKASEIMGKHFSLFFLPEDIASGKPQRELETAASQGVYEESGIRIRKDGTHFWARILVTALKDQQGNLRGYSKIVRDITEEKLKEDKIMQFSRAVEYSPVSIVITDFSGKIEYVNPKFIEVTGYGLSEVVGQSPSKLKSGDQPKEFYQNLWTTIKSGRVWRGEFHNKKKNGDLFWESASISPLYDTSGKVTHFVAVKEDITEIKRTQDEIKLLNLYQKALLDNAGYAIISTDTNGIIKVFNPSAEAMLGYKAEEVINQLTPECIHDPIEVTARAKEFSGELNEDVQPGFKTFVIKSDRNMPNTHEWTYIRKDGTRFPVLLSVSILRDQQQNIFGYIGIASDISEIKKTEEKLLQITERLNLAKSSAKFGVWDWNVVKNVLIWDEQMYRIYGISPDDFSGAYEAWQKGVYPPDLHKSEKAIQAALKGEKDFHIEFRVQWPDTSIHHVQANAIVIRDQQGNARRMIGTNIDITERRVIEERIRESEERFRSAVEYSAIGMALVSLDGRWLQVNPALGKIIGYTNEELLRMNFQSITYPDDLNRDLELVSKVLKGEINFYHMEKRYLHKNGSIVWVMISVSLVRDKEGQPKYFVSQIQDINETKIAEKKLKETFDELEQSNKRMETVNKELTKLNIELKRMSSLKSEFTSMVSHELRTPLTVIKESVGIVFDETAGPVNADQKDFLDTAKRNVDRLGRLINDVLDYQKLESQHAEFRMEEQDINAVISEVGKSFQLPLKSKGLGLILQLQADLPRIIFDKDQITQVLTNYISNAMKFADQGNIALISEKIGDNSVKVSVKDQGIGIKKEDFQKLFQSFSQISTGMGRKTGGTGLGLVLCKKIIEHHNGKVGVDSVFGEGSTFYFFLPIRDRRNNS